MQPCQSQRVLHCAKRLPRGKSIGRRRGRTLDNLDEDVHDDDDVDEDVGEHIDA